MQRQRPSRNTIEAAAGKGAVLLHPLLPYAITGVAPELP
jgi:hypothetical protein